MFDITRSLIAIVGGLAIGLATITWDWVPTIIITAFLLIAYAILFRKPKNGTEA